VLLGSWATDDWQLYLVQLPFNVIVAGAFELFGVGIIQARIVSVAVSALAVGLIAMFVARRFGGAAGLLAGMSLATTSLLLYYGRLAMLEPTELLFLVTGFVLLLAHPAASGRSRILLGTAAGSAFALACGAKPSAVLAVTAMLGAFVLVQPKARAAWIRAAACVGVLLVAAMAWFILIAVQPLSLDRILSVWPQEELPRTLGEMLDRANAYLDFSDRAIPLTRPLLAAAAVGTLVVVARWRHLSTTQRATAAVALAWFAALAAFILAVNYRPNRYVLPALPPLAVLAGAGLGGLASPLRRWTWSLALVAVVVLAVPGIRQLAGWMNDATYRLPQIQSEVLDAIDGSGAVQGSATFGMRVPEPLIVVHPTVNQGDLYVSHGVRWVLVNRETVPNWAPLHTEAWAARTVGRCYPWPSGEACLIHVP
jgi:4-amino-4-deoxy-L-arabinose transferase-like glycosyltransferase